MLMFGLAGTVLGLLRHGPDVLDSFSLALRNNPYVRLPNDTQATSMDSEADFARAMKGLEIRLGDVQPESAIGRIAIGMAGDGGAGAAMLKGGRLYG